MMSKTRTSRRWARLFTAAAVTVALAATVATADAAPGREAAAAIPQTPCQPGDHPETGLQGQVPRADRDSGRSQRGYNCNISLLGQYQGQGATWVQPSYKNCSYIGSFFPGPVVAGQSGGVTVIDASDPTHPKKTATLRSPAMMLGTWETLKVDPVHGYLAAIGVPLPPGQGAFVFDIYDIKTDCAHPRLLNGNGSNLTTPIPVLGHEGAFSPDGNTYYASNATGVITAIDVTNPRSPRVLTNALVGITSHGMGFSPDGRTMFGVTLLPSGIQVLDISDIQDRKPNPRITQISSLSWPGWLTQHTIYFTSHGRTLLYAVDEGGQGGVRLIDIGDLRHPRQLREYRLQIDQPSERATAAADTGGDGAFGYDAHYCSIDKIDDPTMLACSYFQSGVRLFDIRDPLKPRELGYFNPPAQTGKGLSLPNSAHAYTVLLPPIIDPASVRVNTLLRSIRPTLTTDWCSSPPSFQPNNTLFVTCQDNGFLALKYEPAPA